MIGACGENVLQRRAVPQPHPEIHQGGDCGACALGGALAIPVAELYGLFASDGITNSHEMARMLRCAAGAAKADRIVDSAPEWHSNRWSRSFGHPAYFEGIAWFNYLRLAIDAGYYGLAMVDFSGNGGPATNHWILICGARTSGVVTGKTITGEVLVSCSVHGDKWYDASDFLKQMGGYDVLLVRPA